MKYPKPIGPQSDTEFAAMIFGMLAGAYNLLAQYEADERRREDERHHRDILDDELLRTKSAARGPKPRTSPDFTGFSMPDPSKSPAAHREDEQQ